MPHSFGPNELWELIDNARIAIALIIALTVTLGAVVGIIIASLEASLEARRDNKIQTRPEPSLIALEDGIKRLLEKQYGTRSKPAPLS